MSDFDNDNSMPDGGAPPETMIPGMAEMQAGCQCNECLKLRAVTRTHHPGCSCQDCRSDTTVNRYLDADDRRAVMEDIIRTQVQGLPAPEDTGGENDEA